MKFNLRPLENMSKSRILTVTSANGHICQIGKVTCKCDTAVICRRAANMLMGQRSARHRFSSYLSDLRL